MKLKFRIHADQLIGTLYLGASFSLAMFCLVQSHRMSHDQRARDLAGQSIRTGKSTKTSKSNARLIPATKTIGEGSD